MTKNKLLIPLLIIFLVSCAKVPITGRKQVNLVSTQELQSSSLKQYNQFLKQHEVIKNTQELRQLKAVGADIADAVETYLRNNGYKNRIEEFDWEFNLVKDDAVNAWAMPGGKIVFYSGIMDICQNKKGIAVVMGHEIAHAVARHGNERMSQMLAAQLGGVALSAALSEEPEQTQNLIMRAYGVGAQVGVMLPFSRLHESEADQMGLTFMAMAGYDPHAAVNFWQRMHEQSGKSPPEFLSTHPSHESRIADLRKHMDEAMKYYVEN